MTDEKTGYKILCYLAGFVVFMCVMFRGCGKPTTISRLQDVVNCTMGSLKANSAIVGVEIGRSQDSISKSKEALERAEAEIGSSRKISDSIEAGIGELERIIGEAQALSRRSAETIERADAPN